MSDPAHNARLLERYVVEVLCEGDVSVMDELFGEPKSVQGASGTSLDGLEEMKAYVETAIERFEHTDWTIQNTFADEDEAHVRWTLETKLVDEFANVVPAGETQEVEIVTVGHFEDGKLVSAHSRYDRRQLLPLASRIARSGIVKHMDDSVLVLDCDDQVVDLNRQAATTFGVDRTAVIGSGVDALFDATDELPGVGETAAVAVDGGRRHFEVSGSAVTGEGGERVGRLLVFHEVTDRERRTQQLQVLNRVLRHNLRNALTTVRGHAEQIEATTESDGLDSETVAQLAETIVETSDELAEISETVGRVESVFSPKQGTLCEQDLVSVLATVVADIERRYPSVDITVDAPESLSVHTLESLQFALEAVVENACEHNDAADPSVTVTVDRLADGSARIRVADNGPGLPDNEQRALEEGEETPLEHSSGLDLWLVRWVVTLSGGDLAFEDNDPRGTVVTMTVPLADDA